MNDKPDHAVSATLSPAARLRSIAWQLQAMNDEGEFGLCFEHIRADMAMLPNLLSQIADEIACCEPDHPTGAA